jgi:UDP-N-acetylenolpyruvoylglucosamine reductase
MINQTNYSQNRECDRSYTTSRLRKRVMGLLLGATLIYSVTGCNYNSQKPPENRGSERTQETIEHPSIGSAFKRALMGIPRAALEDATEKITGKEKELEEKAKED